MKAPYLRAFEKYELAPRGVTWTDALDFHLQYGAVISTPNCFIMARPVEWGWTDEEHTDIARVADRGNFWHVWAVAGSLAAMGEMALRHGVSWVSYQRHGQERVRRVRVAHLFNWLD